MKDKCLDCREGRETFRAVLNGQFVCTKGLDTQRKRDRLILDMQKMIERPSNCGNPKCENLKTDLLDAYSWPWQVGNKAGDGPEGDIWPIQCAGGAWTPFYASSLADAYLLVEGINQFADLRAKDG